LRQEKKIKKKIKVRNLIKEQKLWAPWRMEYITRSKSDECIFCTKKSATDDRNNLVLHRSDKAFVLMNLYPYNNAHLMIAPYLHVDNIHELDEVTRSEIMELSEASMRVLEEALIPDGFNMGANIGSAAGAGIKDHVHFHVVPRWIGDTNFMPVLGHTKVLVEGLLESYDKLKPLFDKIN
jgi:ATP adenylyltransferase